MKIKNLFIILSLFQALICGVKSSNASHDVMGTVSGMNMEFVPVSNDKQATGVVGSASDADVNVNDSVMGLSDN